MRTIEFETQIINGLIQIPSRFVSALSEKKIPAKVILQISEPQENSFNKKELMKAIVCARNKNIFRKIKNGVDWQKNLRNEWK